MPAGPKAGSLRPIHAGAEADQLLPLGSTGEGLGLPADLVAGPERVPLPGAAERVLRHVLHGGRAGRAGGLLPGRAGGLHAGQHAHRDGGGQLHDQPRPRARAREGARGARDPVHAPSPRQLLHARDLAGVPGPAVPLEAVPPGEPQRLAAEPQGLVLQAFALALLAGARGLLPLDAPPGPSHIDAVVLPFDGRIPGGCWPWPWPRRRRARRAVAGDLPLRGAVGWKLGAIEAEDALGLYGLLHGLGRPADVLAGSPEPLLRGHAPGHVRGAAAAAAAPWPEGALGGSAGAGRPLGSLRGAGAAAGGGGGQRGRGQRQVGHPRENGGEDARG